LKYRDGYGCSRSSDGLYIALAEELVNTYDTEIVTFDKGFINQAAKNAPTVKVNLLTI
jgi:predicted nucleic acid-binding protein